MWRIIKAHYAIIPCRATSNHALATETTRITNTTSKNDDDMLQSVVWWFECVRWCGGGGIAHHHWNHHRPHHNELCKRLKYVEQVNQITWWCIARRQQTSAKIKINNCSQCFFAIAKLRKQVFVTDKRHICEIILRYFIWFTLAAFFLCLSVLH